MAFNLLALLIIVVVVVVAAALLYLAMASGAGGLNVSSPATFVLAGQPRMISSAGANYELVLNRVDSADNRAYVYLYSMPVLVGTVYNVTLDLGQTTHINAGTQYANLGIVLRGLTNESANITVFGIAQYSNTQPDAADLGVVPESALLGKKGGAAATTTIPQGGGASTTTVAQGSTVATTTVLVNSTPALIASLAEKNDLYGLMLNYTKLYASESGCTSALYNNSYSSRFGSAPGGAASYENQSLNTPYQLYSNTTNLGMNNYSITFYDRIQTPSRLDRKAAAYIIVNVRTDAVTTALSGIYEGQDYTSLDQFYTTAMGFSNGCGAYLAAVGG